MRRATFLFVVGHYLIYISIHALREEGDTITIDIIIIAIISIHALREEGDCPIRDVRFITAISIHALREEGDPKPTHCLCV